MADEDVAFMVDPEVERLRGEQDFRRRPWFFFLFLDGTDRTCGHLHPDGPAALDCVAVHFPDVDPDDGLVVKVGGPE